MGADRSNDAGPVLTPEAESSTGPHRMRITSAGSMKGYITFALNFLQNNPSRPLVLHTLPPTPTTSTSSSTRPSRSADEASRTLRPPTLTTPRLINLVEIIKREHIARIERSGSGKGKHKAVGIWQYTETGLVPAELMYGAGSCEGGEEQRTQDEMPELARVLGGKTRPKMTHHPYLQITLSTRPLGLEKRHDPDGIGGYRFTTCQHITVPRRRSTAKGKEGPSIRANASNVVETREVEHGTSGKKAIEHQVGTGDELGLDELGEKVARDDIGVPISRTAPLEPPKRVPHHPLPPPQKTTPPVKSDRLHQDRLDDDEVEVAANPGLTEKKAKDKGQEKKRRRQISGNAIDAEFDAMFGKTPKKKKKQAET